MDTYFIVVIIKSIILLIIGITGLVNIDYFANTYIAGIIFIIGLLVLAAEFNHRAYKKWLKKRKKRDDNLNTTNFIKNIAWD